MKLGFSPQTGKTLKSLLSTNRSRLRHVGDDPIGDDEQDEVLGAVHEVPGDVGHVVDGGGEVGGTVELDPVDAVAVSVQDTCNTKCRR